MTHVERRAYWQQHVTRWRESGLSKKAYCEAHGVNLWGFYRWCRRLTPAAPREAGFIPVRVAAPGGGEPVRVRCGGVEIMVDERSSPAALRVALEALGAAR